MDKAFLDAITSSLNDFATTKFSTQSFELKGPAQENLSYRWRLISTRYKEVTIVLVAKKHFLGKPSPDRFEVYGFGPMKQMAPDLAGLQSFLGTAELAPTG
jgi:hypothetical protein